MRPEQVPLLPPERYPRSTAGSILAAISRQIRHEQARGRTPARIRMDVDKMRCLREAYGWPAERPWLLFGLPVVAVAPQCCLDVEPLESSGRDAFARMVDDAKVNDLLR